MMHQYYPQAPHPYIYELNKDMNFSAAHFIPAPEAGKCQNVHGHTYVVNVTIAGDELDGSGFLVNFQLLKEIVHGKYDHTILNAHRDDFSDEDANLFPTTEVVARTIWTNIQNHLDAQPNKPKCVQVIVRETPTSYVIYRPKAGDIYGL